MPLPSGFGAHTTAREAIGERRLDGTAIVTGGYAGIGLETTRVLAAAGAHVIVPARDRAKATAALGGLANVTIEELELGVPATIDAFAARFGDRPLHLLVAIVSAHYDVERKADRDGNRVYAVVMTRLDATSTSELVVDKTGVVLGRTGDDDLITQRR